MEAIRSIGASVLTTATLCHNLGHENLPSHGRSKSEHLQLTQLFMNCPSVTEIVRGWYFFAAYVGS
jgi:hypothetical protein